MNQNKGKGKKNILNKLTCYLLVLLLVTTNFTVVAADKSTTDDVKGQMKGQMKGQIDKETVEVVKEATSDDTSQVPSEEISQQKKGKDVEGLKGRSADKGGKGEDKEVDKGEESEVDNEGKGEEPEVDNEGKGEEPEVDNEGKGEDPKVDKEVDKEEVVVEEIKTDNKGSGKGKIDTSDTSDTSNTASDTLGGSKGVAINIELEGLKIGDATTITITKKEEESEEEPFSMTADVIVEGDNRDILINPMVKIYVPLGGTCFVSFGDIPGYKQQEDIEIQLSKIGGNFNINKTVTYEPNTKAVELIEIVSESTNLLIGFSTQLNVTVTPQDSVSHKIYWSSDNIDIATVDEFGKVMAVGNGEANITASIYPDDSIEAKTVSDATIGVTINEIEEISSLDKIIVFTGEFIILKDLVSVVADNVTYQVPVTWENAIVVNGVQQISFNKAVVKTIYGDIVGTEKKASLEIEVIGETMKYMNKANLEFQNLSVYIGKSVELKVDQYRPVDANLNALLWESVNPEIATVVKNEDVVDGSATIEGKTHGKTIINLRTPDGELLDSCLVNVGVDPSVMDPIYIMGTLEDSDESVDQFEDTTKVFIKCFDIQAGTYFIKVSDKKSILNVNQKTYASITIKESDLKLRTDADEEEHNVYWFNLADAVEFIETEQNAKSYFVSMSKSMEFPAGDDENGPMTLNDNFKIGSPIPTGEVIPVVKQLVDGELVEIDDSNLAGSVVLLARELGISAEQTTIDKYLNIHFNENREEGTPQYKENPIYPDDYFDGVYGTDEPGERMYNDEVKRIGVIKSDGSVEWDENNVESLKIGGYMLLADLPNTYISNLDVYNPLSEDGALLKEIHLERDAKLDVEIVVVDMSGPVELSSHVLGMYIGGETTITIKTPVVTDTLSWVSSNEKCVTIGDMNADTGEIELIASKDPEDGTGTSIVKLLNGSAVIASCFVSVTLDPSDVDEAYIMGTTLVQDFSVDEYDSPLDVYITCVNLPVGIYNIKVADKDGILNDLDSTKPFTYEITEAGQTETFILWDYAEFTETDKNSKSYFVSMSTNPSFPKGDDDDSELPSTYTDNFKIESPIPTGTIEVNVNQIVDGAFSALELENGVIEADVLLARELDNYTAIETNVELYKNAFFNSETTTKSSKYVDADGDKMYNDEVKNIGWVKDDGYVEWATEYSSESLKIGGYILLIVIPKEYVSDIHEINPGSEDGELMLEVHITRDGEVFRQITIQDKNVCISENHEDCDCCEIVDESKP